MPYIDPLNNTGREAYTSNQTAKYISGEEGSNKTLPVCCGAFRCEVVRIHPLTNKKIPKMVLSCCEWAHDDYSLNIENLPQAESEPEQQGLLGDIDG